MNETKSEKYGPPINVKNFNANEKIFKRRKEHRRYESWGLTSVDFGIPRITRIRAST